MKVMLIVPTFKYDQHYPAFLSVSDFHTGFAYLASSLKEAGHEVVGINPNNITGYATAHDMIKDVIISAIEKHDPGLIGLGGLCTDYHFIRDAIDIIRERYDVPMVLGGQIVTNDKEYIMQDLHPDFCIIGEGEEAIVKLANAISSGSYWGRIQNIGYWDVVDGLVFTEEDYNYKDIDALPFPDYEPFGISDMLDNYSMATRLLYRYTRENPRVMSVVTARSCPFKCTFCVHDRGPKYRARAIPNIMEEIKLMHEKYNFNMLLMLDELFAVNKKRMQEFCLALIDCKERYGWDFDWTFQTHASARLDEYTIALAKKAGCCFFSYGIESASPKVLKSMNKKTNVNQITEAIELAKAAGVGFGGNLIFGDIAEDEQTICESMQFRAEYCKSAFVFMGFVMPYPGSKLFDYCMEKGLVTDKKDYYENINRKVYNMTGMDTRQWVEWIKVISNLERGWFVENHTNATAFRKLNGVKDHICAYDNSNIYAIEALCPICGKAVSYTQPFRDMDLKQDRLFIGTGCTNCNQKIRIDIGVQ